MGSFLLGHMRKEREKKKTSFFLNPTTPPKSKSFLPLTASVGATPQSSDLFDRVTAAIEATATHDFSAIRGRVKRDFEYFSLAGTGKALPSRLDKSAPTEKALDEREQRFLSDFHSLLKTAHFKVLSAGEWETAQAENFTVSFFLFDFFFVSFQSSFFFLLFSLIQTTLFFLFSLFSLSFSSPHSSTPPSRSTGTPSTPSSSPPSGRPPPGEPASAPPRLPSPTES